MSDNPIALIRFIGNAALVAVTAAFLLAFAFQGRGLWDGWFWVLGGVSLGYAIISFMSYFVFADKADAAWDEQVQASHAASLAFGYWAALAMFLALLALVWTDTITANAAFFLMAPVLGAAPALWFTIAGLRGRAG